MLLASSRSIPELPIIFLISFTHLSNLYSSSLMSRLSFDIYLMMSSKQPLYFLFAFAITFQSFSISVNFVKTICTFSLLWIFPLLIESLDCRLEGRKLLGLLLQDPLRLLLLFSFCFSDGLLLPIIFLFRIELLQRYKHGASMLAQTINTFLKLRLVKVRD